jgi:hypothetical protein
MNKLKEQIHEINLAKALNAQLATLIGNYEALIIKTEKRQEAVAKEEADLKIKTERFREEERALIEASKQLDAAQKKVIKDQEHLDSQIKTHDKLLLEANSKATKAADFEAELLEKTVQERVDAKLKQMMRAN